ncbi:tumor necrosis factor receptor superfamily member 14 isoform X2 [Sphaeramia orbicularis]|uniref:tumor necrosis factor receptor superfamily member 14 isoform X2 n=1 Tax=Sphaeramia orbicularis TaxID=375764 RepID=UPI001180B207|nr:tumor necrosis factor receptor superfamily member 14-like isoform X2 [Sphaeramia orbicularis]
MRLVQCFLTVLMLPAQLVLSSPVTDTYSWYGSECKFCPAGEYQKSCTVCEPCPPGKYTTGLNREESCHRCFSDCRPDFNLKVVQNCTRTSNLKCICDEGFICTEKVHGSDNCRSCKKIQHVTATAVPPRVKQTPSSEQGSTSTQPCRFPKCVSKAVSPPENGTHPKTGTVNSQLAAILCPMVAIGCVIGLVILFCIRRPGDETCFKQTIEKLWNEEGRDAAHKQKESSHQFPRDSFSAKQQPSSMSTASLGSVHVYNPGTVIFSLLSHFTNQVSPTVETGKAAERAESSEEEDERDCPVFHPTSSPSIHLSEEERRGETDSIFFPSQEQGKDCHVSKEEGL